MNTNLKIILAICEKLTPQEIAELFDKVEEVYCLGCGRLRYECRCDIDDRW